MSNYLHIVCLDAPSPPDYGGAIDMFYKVRALSRAGKKIILHYFDYNPVRGTKELEQYCDAIHAYKRKNIVQSLPLTQPYIIQSRVNQELVERLNKDNFPILLEGLHCAGIIPFLQQQARVVIRMHNEEASYYHHLAQTTSSYLKRKYFIQESRLLGQYQEKLDKSIRLACLSETDMNHFENQYGFQNVHFIPCFIPWQEVRIREGMGSYCLYHGNMTVSENEEAVCWLIENIFSRMDTPFIVAGKGISKKLAASAKNCPNISFVSNPSIQDINELVQNAHIHVLPSMNRTGVKLKLLNALLNGRFCITNQHGVMGSRIGKGVWVLEDSAQWITCIRSLMQQPFTPEAIAERKQILELYNNRDNAGKLSALWLHCQ